ncbi:hypothetical protein [Halobaculum sp. D14]|uniref:hypothetical protein n=1 Tax=Halobaculum sp. D14 TaxID=3421642 RepID=UPI003EBE88BF
MNYRRFIRRRTVLSALGTGVGTVGSIYRLVSAEASTSIPHEDQFRKTLETKYGPEGASVAVDIMKQIYPKKESGKLSQNEFHSEVTRQYLDREATEQIALEVLATDLKIGAENTALKEVDSSELPEVNEVTTAETGTQTAVGPATVTTDEIPLGYSTTSESTGGTGQTSVNVVKKCFGYTSCAEAPSIVDPQPDEMNLEAAVGLYGNATASIEFANRNWSPDSNGEYEFTIRYYRQGKVTAGTAEFEVTLAKPDGVTESSSVETVNAGTVQGVYTQDVRFPDLDSSKNYDVGFKSTVMATTAGGGGFADFRTTRDFDRYAEPRSKEPLFDQPAIEVQKV